MSREGRRVTGYDRGLIEDWWRWRNFEPGMWAWLLHGFTGGVVLAYLVAQVTVYGVAYWLGPDTFLAVAEVLGASRLVQVINLAVYAVFVFHMFNGIRITLFDMARAVDYQKELFFASVIATVTLVVVAVPVFLPGVL